MKRFVHMIFLFVLAAVRPVYGGQAIINGVMMKGKNHYSLSVHSPKGLVTQTHTFISLTKRFKILGWPFIRGVVALIEMMVLGYKVIMKSADLALDEGETEEKSSGMGLVMIFSILLSIALALFLFKFLPLGAATLLDKSFAVSTPLFNVIVGVVKLAIFIAYLALIGLYSDMKELFRFHGAEHKTINCFEAGDQLSVRKIKQHTRKHLRCGTTFIFVVIFLAIAVSLFIPKTMPFWLSLALRIALLPVIAALSYELQRFTARSKISLFKPLLIPGLWLQGLTTNEPTSHHIKAASTSLKAVIEAETK